MSELSDSQWRQLHDAAQADPSLGDGLAPLLAGDFGARARELTLACLARRLLPTASTHAALLLALADALRHARTSAHSEAPPGSLAPARRRADCGNRGGPSA